MLKREKSTHVKNIDKAMLTYLQREKYESQAQPKGFFGRSTRKREYIPKVECLLNKSLKVLIT